jgi:hypothetical protein
MNNTKKADLIDALQAELNAIEYTPISSKSLANFGCKFTGEKIEIRTSNDEFVIYELQAEDEIPRRVLAFCYISSKLNKAGFILANPFEKYKRLAAY